MFLLEEVDCVKRLEKDVCEGRKRCRAGCCVQCRRKEHEGDGMEMVGLVPRENGRHSGGNILRKARICH